MASILVQVPAWMTASVLAAAMIAAWAVGYWHTRRLPMNADPPGSKVADATLALLGLLLAFTFSMSLGKHDERRLAVLAESNAIGDFYTCASLLKEPVRPQLQAVIRDYTQQRLDTTQQNLERGAAFEAIVRKSLEAHARMTDLVGQALADGTPEVVPLTNTLNNLTSNHAARVFAVHDRLPWSMVVVLFIGSIVAMFLMGQQHGATRKASLAGVVGFILLISLVVFVTLDLNQPYSGLITVSQEPMERLRAALGP
jgi:hypothetical protein